MFRARLAGVFYLLVFMTGGLALFVRGRLGSAAGLIAGACYIAVTLLFYGIFKLVNRNLSLLAAFISLVGIIIGPFGSRRLLHQPSGIFRILLPADRLPHFQVHLFASNSGCADGVCRFGLADLSVTAAGRLSVPLHFHTRTPRRGSADAVAPYHGRERTTLEGTGERCRGIPLLAPSTL